MSMQERNRYLDFLIDPSFQGVNRLFVLLFENNTVRKSYKHYYFPAVEIKPPVQVPRWPSNFVPGIKTKFKDFSRETHTNTHTHTHTHTHTQNVIYQGQLIF